jgi:hypothetical protein
MTGNINSQISKAQEDLMGDSIDQANKIRRMLKIV